IDYELDQDGKMTSATVNMSQPVLNPADIQVKLDSQQVVGHEVEITGKKFNITCVSMGNPHVIIFCDDVSVIDLEKIGPVIENDPLFPQRINVHFVSVDSRSELTMRTWERGTGITLACGTGACAVCVAGVLNELSNRNCLIHLPGGDLTIDWCEKDNCLYMTGPAVEVFEGTWPL
ncbi:MAG: diaminopimelate epimerase, partial [Bacteroidales bacterium]|nr:diaminopimelate epimerase [Bacteroidales bacterium]